MIYLGANPGVVYTGGYGYGTGMINGTLSVTIAGNNRMTIALKTRAGLDPTVADPVMILFPTTAVTGGFTIITVSTAVSLVIWNGSTMGVTNATAFRIWIVGFNDAGTFRLGAINCSTATQIFSLFDGIRSSTAEGGTGTADSAGVIYTGVAVTNQPMRVLGYAEWNSSGLAAAGTWTSTNFTYVQLYGPGIPTPGQVIQTLQTTTSTPTTITNTTTKTATANALTVTPTNAANLCRVVATSGTNKNNDGSGPHQNQIGRDSSSNLIGGQSGVYTDPTQINFYIGTTLMGFDKPNKNTATVYTVYMWATTATSTFTYNSQAAGPGIACMQVEELMG
jgi:hypothetical protein